MLDRIPARSVCGVLVLSCLMASAATAQDDVDQRAQIEAVRQTVISSELTGQIEALPFREGESFDAGDTLVQLDCARYAAVRDQMAAKYAAARRKRDSNEELARLQSVGQLELDLSRLNVQETAAELRAARADVSRCEIDAPYAGRVVRRHARLGQSVSPQDKLLDIVGRDLEARVIVPATWLSWIESGTDVSLDVVETGERVDGHVERVGASVDPVSHTVPVWAPLADSATLRPGMSARATFPNRPASARPGESDTARASRPGG